MKTITQIKFTKDDPNMGQVEGFLRIDGKLLFFKFNDHEYSRQVMANFQKRGAIITPGGSRKWIRVNIFGALEEAKLGEVTFNVKETPEEETQEILTKFYIVHFTKAGFLCERKELPVDGK